ncbi:MAG: hypothetical protein QM755_04145 [Luteolibacter sp.]
MEGTPRSACAEYQEALRRWIELDPAGAWAEAQKSPKGGLAHDLMLAWVELDPQQALEMFGKSGRTLISSTAKDFFSALMAKDPTLAALALKDDRWSSEKLRFLGYDFRDKVYRQWMFSDPGTAQEHLADVLKNHPSPDGNPGRDSLLAAFAVEDFHAAWARISTTPNSEDLAIVLAAGLQQRSPEAIAALEKMVKDGAGNKRMWESLAGKLALEDPEQALALAEKCKSNADLKDYLLKTSARLLAASDPEGALDLLGQASSGKVSWEDGNLIESAFETMARENPDQAAARLTQLPANQRAKAMGGYFSSVFSQNPEAAVELYRQWEQDPTLAKQAHQGGYEILMQANHTTEVLQAIPELNDAVDEGVIFNWTGDDAAGAVDWVANRLAEGKKVDLGLMKSDFLNELSDLPTDFSTQWLERVSDPQLRAEAVTAVIGKWVSQDPERAKGWVDGLPDGALKDQAAASLAIGLNRTQ